MEDKKSLVWWVAIIIIVLLAIAFWFYYQAAPVDTGYSAVTVTPDAVSSIESDLKATDLSKLDSELADIDKELAQ